ncbi:MAG TPA: hypothetical protein PK530_05725, partial [Anaerolineales bacterium]|nr:hypothetical protein [Anaerolineales bacterium]
MRFLFLFLDGVGLGKDDPVHNPFCFANLPHLNRLLDGQPLTAQAAPLTNGRATLRAWDATLGVRGLPQSASGQATLLTGENVPARIGEHYGPKPNPAIAEILRGQTVFTRLDQMGYTTALLAASPPGYFQVIESGKRMFSAIPMAAFNAG